MATPSKLAIPGTASYLTGSASVQQPMLPVVRSLFENPEAYGFCLYVGAAIVLGTEELEETNIAVLRDRLERGLHLRQIDDGNFNKLMAVLAILHTDLFYRDLPSFIEICNILSDSPPMAGMFDPADTWEMCWAVTEAWFIDENPGIEFSEDIRAYMGMMLLENGFLSPPHVLSMAIMPSNSHLDAIDDQEILEESMTSNVELHREVDDMLLDNTQMIIEQLSPIVDREELDRWVEQHA